jgi:hypothetical protein
VVSCYTYIVDENLRVGRAVMILFLLLAISECIVMILTDVGYITLLGGVNYDLKHNFEVDMGME